MTVSRGKKLFIQVPAGTSGTCTVKAASATSPAGVVVWGPNLVYGAVLGVAEHAARPLTPAVDEDDQGDAQAEITKVYEL